MHVWNWKEPPTADATARLAPGFWKSPAWSRSCSAASHVRTSPVTAIGLAQSVPPDGFSSVSAPVSKSPRAMAGPPSPGSTKPSASMLMMSLTEKGA